MLTSSVGWSAAMPADMIEVFESYGENGTAGEEGGGEPQDGSAWSKAWRLPNRGEWNRAQVATVE